MNGRSYSVCLFPDIDGQLGNRFFTGEICLLPQFTVIPPEKIVDSTVCHGNVFLTRFAVLARETLSSGSEENNHSLKFTFHRRFIHLSVDLILLVSLLWSVTRSEYVGARSF